MTNKQQQPTSRHIWLFILLHALKIKIEFPSYLNSGVIVYIDSRATNFKYDGHRLSYDIESGY